MTAIYLLIIIVILVLLISRQLTEKYDYSAGQPNLDDYKFYEFHPLAPIVPTPPRSPPTPVGKLYDW